MNTRKRAAVGAVIAVGVIGGMLAPSAASAHGYIMGDTLTARVALTANADRGPIQYEPQSLEAPKGYPETGPADGQLASAGNKSAAKLDEQSAERWVKNDVGTGTVKVDWKFTAPHKTSQWRYFMTRADWDPNDKLQRSDFELIGTVTHDGTPASTNPVHTITIPEDRTGYHVIYAVWDIADTSNAYYNVIDVNVTGHGATGTPAGTTPPATTADAKSLAP
jgi:chitin-binding protein